MQHIYSFENKFPLEWCLGKAFFKKSTNEIILNVVEDKLKRNFKVTVHLYWDSIGTAKCGLTNHIIIISTKEIWPAYKYIVPLDQG